MLVSTIIRRRCFSSSVKHMCDLTVIGGGSAGLALSREASKLGASVMLLNDTQPSTTRQTKWEGLGGTCVNVGCIPKKLFYRSGKIHTALQEASQWGWHPKIVSEKVNWNELCRKTQNYIKRLNFAYRTQLRSNSLTIINALGKLSKGSTSVEYVDPKTNQVKTIHSKYVAIATGVRPYIPETLMGKELCITSDDVFTLPKPPGKTLVIGGSYVAIELAGILAHLGYPTSLAIRSSPLRSLDVQCVNVVINSLKESKVTVLNKTTIEKIFQPTHNHSMLQVDLRDLTKNKVYQEQFDTVLLATGRVPNDLELIQACQRDKNGFIKVNEKDETNVRNVYALGDVTGKIQLTPVAIQSATLLARRLFANKTELMSYDTIPTSVFAPLEYACVGLSQEQAEQRYTAEKIDVFVQQFKPLESAFLEDNSLSIAFAKLICLRDDPHTVLGLHFVGSHASEIIQGFSLAVQLKLSKTKYLDKLLAIHPTAAEVFTQLENSVRSGLNSNFSGISCGGGRCG